MEAAVIGKDLRKSYGDFVAVDGIDFEIPRGVCFGFLGPNGAGKTTTMRMIYRASPIGGGSLNILGHDVGSGRNDRRIKQQLGVVPQDDNLDQELSVRENLEVFARFYGLSRKQAKARAVELLEFVHLTERAESKVLELSGGMKRRVLIAKALSHEPSVLFLDEPTAGVDVELRTGMWETVDRLRAAGTTIILTTHYIEEAEAIADRVAVINQGRILLVEEKERLLHRMGRKQLTIELQEPVAEIPPALAAYGLERAEDGNALVYTYDRAAERTGITSLLGDLAEAGFTLRDLHTRQSSLEDIFVDLVRERS